MITDNQKKEIIKLRAAGQGYGEIANELNISVNTIKSYCQRNGLGNIRTEPKGDNSFTPCEFCGKPVKQTPGRKHKRFCSNECKTKWWNRNQGKLKTAKSYICKHCGSEFKAHKKQMYCSHSCYIKDRFGGE